MSLGSTTFDLTPRRFDVVCAGQAFFRLVGGAGGDDGVGAMRFRPGGGAVNAAVALVKRGLRTGLATTLPDDTYGRTLRSRLENAGIDVGGVSLAVPRTSLFVVAGGADQEMVSHRDDLAPVVVPSMWSSRVLFLSGLSPVVAHAAATCKAARAGRRLGAIVVIELSARHHVWRGQDPRATNAALGEADVVRCTTEDLAVLGFDAADLRARMRREAVLVTSGGARAFAAGPFGEVAMTAERDAPPDMEAGAGDALTAAICHELVRAAAPGEGDGAMWQGILRRGVAAARSTAWAP